MKISKTHFIHNKTHKYIKCLRWVFLLFHVAHFETFWQCKKKKRWDSSMFTLCSIPSALNNSLWTSLLGRRVLSHSDLIEGSSCLGHIFFVSVFSFLFCWWKVWTAGRQLHCSTTKPCCCKRCTMWFNFVLLKHARPSLFEGSISCSKTCAYL